MRGDRRGLARGSRARAAAGRQSPGALPPWQVQYTLPKLLFGWHCVQAIDCQPLMLVPGWLNVDGLQPLVLWHCAQSVRLP